MAELFRSLSDFRRDSHICAQNLAQINQRQREKVRDVLIIQIEHQLDEDLVQSLVFVAQMEVAHFHQSMAISHVLRPSSVPIVWDH